MKSKNQSKGSSEQWQEMARAFPVSDSGSLPVHKQVSSVIASLIDNGVWEPGDRIPGERDLAACFGISAITANKSVTELVRQGRLARVLGRGTFVSASKRQGIHLAVVMHCSLTEASSDYYASGLMRGIQSALMTLGFDHSVTYLDSWHDDALAAMPTDRELGVLCIAPLESHISNINRLADMRIHTVVLGASWPNLRVPTIDADNFGGVCSALDYLLEMGHSRIGCLYAFLHNSNHRDRLRAFREHIAQRHMHIRPDWLGEITGLCGTDASQPEGDVRRFLMSPDRPAAVLVTDYHIVPILVQQAQELGIRLPDDLSIVAFDDPNPSIRFHLPLTTLEQPLEMMGRKATEKLLALCEGLEEGMTSEVIPMSLVTRESCSPPADAKDAHLAEHNADELLSQTRISSR